MADGQNANQVEVVAKVWREVIITVNKLLEADTKFGFHKIEANLNPKIEDITHGLGFLDFLLSAMVDSDVLDHDQTRMALNSKQCILIVRRLAEALKSGDQEEYAQAIKLLNSQAQI